MKKFTKAAMSSPSSSGSNKTRFLEKILVVVEGVGMFAKSGAMFGLCRALRKQSGGLFLASRHSEAPQGANGSVKATRGAMFGLDARIALAIFGALSVISGAALFSAIQTVQTERYWQSFQEIIKASEQYYLDNGKMLPTYVGGALYTPDLVENRENLSTWKGPYIVGKKFPATYIRNSVTKSFVDDAKLFVGLYESSTWTSLFYDSCVVDSSDCVEWVRLYSGNSAEGIKKVRDLFSQLDKIKDNSDGIKAGNVRMYEDVSSSPHINLYIKGIPHKRIS